MTDYISREDALAKFRYSSDQLSEKIAYIRVEEVPAADVVPVRHGHYVGEFDGYADGNPVYDMWYCSECGCYFEEWDEKPTYNYCPNCGARMDGDGNV